MVISKKWKDDEEEFEALNARIEAINSMMSNNSNNGSPLKSTDTMKNVSEWKANQMANIDDNVENAKIILLCQPNSHPFQTRTIFLENNVEIKVGRSIARSRATDNNAIFDCKVLSRNHAVLWYSDGKFYVKDTQSSNGTFINERRINQSEAEELSSGDLVKFGVDVIENSRKEIHGCIIAHIKLYLPDGQPYISNNNLNKSDYNNEKISVDQLHRLYHAMQETEQREKILEVKIHDLQNILDITRKNTTDCWQAMVDEDRLLNRIDFLENKLNCYQKNYPEENLKDDISKLHEDKFVYQNLAKDALNKVYQERIDAIQKLATIERALCSSENECAILRDHLLKSQQCVQDLNSKYQKIKEDFKEYKDEVKENEEDNSQNQKFDANQDELLKNKEKECEEYKSYIDELLQEKNELKKRLSVQSTIESPTKNSNSVITEWFKKSELNSNEESAKIIEAICNESDDDESSVTEENFNQLKLKLSVLEKNIKLIYDNTNVITTTKDENINDGNESFDNEIIFKNSLEILKEIYCNVDKYSKNTESKKDEENLYKIHIDELESKLATIDLEIKSKPSQKDIDEKIVEIKRLTEKFDSCEKIIENLQNDKNDLEETVLKLKDEINLKCFIKHTDDDQVNEEKEAVDSIILNLNNAEPLIDTEIQKDLDVMNDTNMEKEEELILFKEKYESILVNNNKLKEEYDLLKYNMNNMYNSLFIKFCTTTILIAVICYLIMSYL